MFFKKPEPQDTTSVIHLASKELPLDADNTAYNEAILIIQNQMRKWLDVELELLVENNIEFSHSLILSLKKIDLKFLGYPTQRMSLLSYLTDTETNQAGTRFLDLVTRIALMIPPRIFETLKGRFIYGMIYAISVSNTTVPYPSKEQWATTLAELPWIPLLLIYQDLYDSLDVEGRVNQLLEAATSSHDA